MEHYSRPVAGYTAPAYPPAHPSTFPNSHPYVTPPPHAVYHARPFWDPQATFLRRVIGIIIASAIVAGTIVLITWLALRPRLPQFRVDSLSLTHFNLTASPQSLLTANWDVRLTARNPNRKSTLYYDRVAATVFYKSESPLLHHRAAVRGGSAERDGGECHVRCGGGVRGRVGGGGDELGEEC
ncbi:hypothetical protein Acr_23g0014770 [Actinidia rufa]|uniref:Late embryogenesis abundant (LEA) hydroxyproline-rich glycoprotein family n=1 Tax=Actinidia rufa TaxID=165716 RepID=A0A7J0GQL7_9ERIC|nr:hypothetical protein Acr_23g0014770 [Actinidia rufa]